MRLLGIASEQQGTNDLLIDGHDGRPCATMTSMPCSSNRGARFVAQIARSPARQSGPDQRTGERLPADLAAVAKQNDFAGDGDHGLLGFRLLQVGRGGAAFEPTGCSWPGRPCPREARGPSAALPGPRCSDSPCAPNRPARRSRARRVLQNPGNLQIVGDHRQPRSETRRFANSAVVVPVSTESYRRPR